MQHAAQPSLPIDAVSPVGRANRSPTLKQLDGRDFRHFIVKPPLGAPEVAGLLHSEPDAGPVAAELSKAQGHVGSDARFARQNAVQRLTADAHLPGGFSHRQVQCRQDVLSWGSLLQIASNFATAAFPKEFFQAFASKAPNHLSTVT